jgi:methylisocitrate lyase
MTHMESPYTSLGTAGAQLRAIMDDHCVAAPGAYNGLVARAVTQAGFEAAYVSGAAVSASAGVPDVGLVSLDGFCAIIQQVAASSGLPVVADADTGFGEVEMVARTVHAYCAAGAAGLHIEDQVFPKRCGHLDGKQLIPVEHFQEKVAIAAAARDACSAGSFIICARTDARGVEGIDAAIARAKAYVQAGADMIFPEGLTCEAEFEQFATAMTDIGGPSRRGGPYLLANMTEFGKTPMIPLNRFAELGYDLVIYPVTTLRITMKAVAESLAVLKDAGSAAPILEKMQTRSELYDLLGYTPGVEWTYPNPTRHE